MINRFNLVFNSHININQCTHQLRQACLLDVWEPMRFNLVCYAAWELPKEPVRFDLVHQVWRRFCLCALINVNMWIKASIKSVHHVKYLSLFRIWTKLLGSYGFVFLAKLNSIFREEKWVGLDLFIYLFLPLGMPKLSNSPHGVSLNRNIDGQKWEELERNNYISLLLHSLAKRCIPSSHSLPQENDVMI